VPSARDLTSVPDGSECETAPVRTAASRVPRENAAPAGVHVYSLRRAPRRESRETRDVVLALRKNKYYIATTVQYARRTHADETATPTRAVDRSKRQTSGPF
jgi:hypothetical protein